MGIPGNKSIRIALHLYMAAQVVTTFIRSISSHKLQLVSKQQYPVSHGYLLFGAIDEWGTRSGRPMLATYPRKRCGLVAVSYLLVDAKHVAYRRVVISCYPCCLSDR